MFEIIGIATFGVAAFLCRVLTRWVRDYSNARGWNALPESDRHIHTRRIPRLGGVAIFLALWGTGLLASMAGHFGAFGFIPPQSTFRILGPATLIFAVGLIDDFLDLSPYVKFVAQAGAAILLFCNGFGISQVSLLSHHPHLDWVVGLPLTILWVVWVTNAFNLIDGLDGLAAGSALFSTLVTCVVALCFHNEGILLLSLALGGAIAGFLRYNFNPASIFLGDCGSLLIGFLLSAMALAGSQKAPTMAAVAIPVVSLGLPILDVTVSVLRRFLSCRGLFQADREHIHHKLLGRGISHKQTVLVLYGVSAGFGLLSLFLLHPTGALAFSTLMVLGIGVFVGVRQLGYLEFLELGRVAARALKQRRVIANDLNIRRAPEALRSCTSLPHFCQILQQCLKPAGIDGFGLYLESELPANPEIFPLKHSGSSKLLFFWNRSLRLSEAQWSMSFGLESRSGERLGTFTLYRKNASASLLMDPEIFTEIGFAKAVAEIVEKMRDAWLARPRVQQGQKPEMPSPLTATRINRAAQSRVPDSREGKEGVSMNTARTTAVILLACLLPITSRAQASSSPAMPKSSGAGTSSPSAPAASTPACAQEIRSTYLLGPDDQIEISAPELTEFGGKPGRIDSDGNIQAPLVGHVHVAGLTAEQAEEALDKSLSAYIRDPQVVVNVSEIRSQPVSVLGAVNTPGVHQVRGHKTLLEMLSEAGGVRQDAGYSVRITRQVEWGCIPLPGARFDPTKKFSIAEVNLRQIMEAKDPAENIQIFPHDVITVPKAEMIYVVGDVKRSGGFVLGEHQSMSVLEALSLAEGLNQGADEKHARILRLQRDADQREELPVNIKELFSGKKKDVSMQGDDILFVPGSTGKKAALRTLEAAIQTGTGVAIWRIP